jgi:hypothetical protein
VWGVIRVVAVTAMSSRFTYVRLPHYSTAVQNQHVRYGLLLRYQALCQSVVVPHPRKGLLQGGNLPTRTNSVPVGASP